MVLELIKRSFELSVKMRWLKLIDRECDKAKKLRYKLDRQNYIINCLLNEYKNKYGEDLRKGGVE